MSLVRNSASYPVKLVSYQIDKTRFGKNDEVVYPGECRYVNANNFSWDTALISAFTEHANPPGGVEVTGASVNLFEIGVGVSVDVSRSEAMAGMIMGKHDFVEFYQDGDKPSFRMSNGEGGCRVNHGW